MSEHHSNAFPMSDFPASTESDDRLTSFSAAVELLGELGQAGLEDVDDLLGEAVDRLGQLADSVESSLSEFNDDHPDVMDLLDFVIESCNMIRQVAFNDGQEPDRQQLELLLEAVDVRLESSDTISQLSTEIEDVDAWGDDSSPLESADGSPDVVTPSREEIAALLGQLSAQTQSDLSSAEQASPQPTTTNEPIGSVPVPVSPTPAPEPKEMFVDRPAGSGGDPTRISTPEIDNVQVDEELMEAFMDDATRGLESMEQALLDLESSPSDPAIVKAIGRELHTIKGASASIGLSNLASYIHEVEELIRYTQDSGKPVTPELLLPHVDLVRARVDGEDIPQLASAVVQPSSAQQTVPAVPVSSNAIPASPNVAPVASTPAANAPGASKTTRKSASGSDSHGDDETVRVKASQLNRLMDMLSELVMLRNQRDTEISELKGIHDELIHSVTRIRMLSHEGEALLASDNLADPILAEEGVSFSHLNEVANDVLESAQRLRDCYQPVDDGNQAVSQFIRNFRLELVQLRRTPVSGLFRRLHRAISDAARSEQKQVRVELVGENTGIERSLQERIFEPLLHIVRNSVSHGVETPTDRIAAGKEAHGVVKLHAHAGPDLLVIEVSDDGRGLDYDAIRRRGIERGLIESDKSISRAELARLIFNPGFSTKETASQVSGRGVGMDVVAATLERMRGWVEVESETGRGSTIRLSLPLPSMIQHAMVFRSAGQLFALPAQAVRRTGEHDRQTSPVDLNDVLSLQGSPATIVEEDERRSVIELVTNGSSLDGSLSADLALLVDRVLGPEEVVVRPMPPMLKSHPLCIGATLSGMGETVLLLDPRGVAEAAIGSKRLVHQISQSSISPATKQPKVLVVDDSKSARLKTTRALQKYSVEIIQAADGQAAMELLAKDDFVTVFSDIDMPRMSGLELLQTIKAEPRLEAIPVIVISSRSIDTAGKQAREYGALEYLQKPLVPERLDAIVASLPWAKP
ncbi:hybrid sensor histidine kinase/response regulator [Roseiconus lacunae]|uniref:histidine kinase n=1 Tax=Roseiconus lacunae TaxID=2605694 RepID=A0ABT7PLV6_9BACT|nr:response regulator [Roseiconus lacunae]MDM4017455.1 response regulator [Roseiconus lacunae]